MSEQERKPKVWKIGSRWGRIPIFDIFWKYGLVFVGNSNGRLKNKVRQNDYLAISKGITVIAVAKAAENGKSLSNKDINSKDIENLVDCNFFKHAEGVSCHIIKLEQKDRFTYKAIKSFCKANKIDSKIKYLYETYNIRTDIPSKYDSKFLELINNKSLSWYPWVGNKYSKGEKRVLLVGDSHYKHRNPTYLSKNYTRKVIQHWGLGNSDKQIFNRNLRYALIGKKTNKRIKNNFWQTVSFYNFVQKPMKDSNTSPSDKDFLDGWETFKQIVDILKPTDIIFFGVRASDSVHSDQKYISVRKEEKKINNTYGKILRIKDDTYSNIKIFAIRHPSSCFSWSEWNNHINDLNPELISFLKNESFDNLSI